MGALNDIIEGIQRAFHPSPLQIALVVAAAALLVAGFTAYYLLEKSRQRRVEHRHAAETYRALRDRHHLTPSEEDLVERMALCLKTPEKKYLLLSNQGLFNACAHRLIREGEIPEAGVAALRVKLGFFGEGPDISPTSTASIPNGSAVVLRYRGNAYRGRVLEPQTSSLRLRVDFGKQPAVFFPGSPVDLVYQNRRGTFTFRTSVQKQERLFLFLAHSEEVQRAQRREHYRRKVNLPVFIKATGSEDRPQKSRFIDLGGGGASLQNPGAQFRKGDEIDLSFHPDSEDRLSLTAHVVRTSHAGNVLHVDFGHLRESVRDRIYRVLFDKRSSPT
ncbi:PilZ domain-containing protein [Salinispira pacifica]